MYLFGGRPFTAGLCLGVEQGMRGMKAGTGVPSLKARIKNKLFLVHQQCGDDFIHIGQRRIVQL